MHVARTVVLLRPRFTLPFLATLGLLAGCAVPRSDAPPAGVRSAGFVLPEDVTIDGLIEADAASAAPRVWPAGIPAGGDAPRAAPI
ncbi:hypothetical protein [Marinivivus vitaminiproducens]|uniref:hypothetical protein n=1 Tax=Marinivivus vitaminiproducens TaxID=3035935 RepID=UPI00279F34C5|nr:hypothetical protein P4R82_17005 [Geminicoccaceae bacterium SCSIO 64248]